MDQFVAQVEREPGGGLVAVLYVNGGRTDTQPVESVRQGRRRVHDLLCAAVDAQLKELAAADRVARTTASGWCHGAAPTVHASAPPG